MAAVERPAGAGWPVLVTAVAVVRFFAIVLFTTSTKTASSSAMPPPSCAETLFTMVLSAIRIRSCWDGEMCEPLVISSRMPPPSSLARLAATTLCSIDTGPLPSESWLGSAGSSPPTRMPPPSS